MVLHFFSYDSYEKTTTKQTHMIEGKQILDIAQKLLAYARKDIELGEIIGTNFAFN